MASDLLGRYGERNERHKRSGHGPARGDLLYDAVAQPLLPHSDKAAIAGYVADMTAQLETMANAAGLDLLAYFLAMARAESEAAARAATAEPRATGNGMLRV